MRRVVKVMPGSQCMEIASFEVDDNELSDLFIKANIGTSDGTSYFERTNFYGIPRIDVLCDEEGKLKNLKPSLQLPNDVIAGDCIIVSLEASTDDGEFGWFGLNENQFDLVIEKLVF
ncbi:MAG: hypothetical protein RM338_05605 [Nostoc sp. DedQUE12a]|nr:hypothetical protein [Nostoc sp. DedQUE12a]